MRPIDPPPAPGPELDEWRKEVAARVRSLLAANGLAGHTPVQPSTETENSARWRKLAVRLAIKHGEPGFKLAKPADFPSRKAQEDELQDELMNRFLWCEPVIEYDVSYLRDVEGDKTIMSEVEAAKLTERELNRLSRQGFYTGSIPKSGSIREQYNKRKNTSKNLGMTLPGRNTPSYVIHFLDVLRILQELDEIAEFC